MGGRLISSGNFLSGIIMKERPLYSQISGERGNFFSRLITGNEQNFIVRFLEVVVMNDSRFIARL